MILMSLAALLNFLIPFSASVDSNCDFFQYMIVGQEYYVYNNEYPNNYSSLTACRWMGQGLVGTRIVLSCDISMPSTANCAGDKLRISLTGLANFTDSSNYCGIGGFTLITEKNLVSIGLFSTTGSFGGKFICSLTAMLDNENLVQPENPVASATCDCGWKKSTRIVGGTATLVNEFPSMAGLIDLNQRRLYCGGSIISDRYVLTAAHCLLQKTANDLAVLVGDHNITSGTDTTAAALYRLEAFEVHPDFDANAQINDIAILRTLTVIKFSFSVGPVCLPFRFTLWDFYTETVTALGWGMTEFSGPSSDVLLKVNLKVTSNEYCYLQHPENNIRGSQMCTYAPGKDTCQQDSGGPLLWMDNNKMRLHLVGVVSYGLGCATEIPAVNSRVTSFLSWIVSRTSDARYCIK